MEYSTNHLGIPYSNWNGKDYGARHQVKIEEQKDPEFGFLTEKAEVVTERRFQRMLAVQKKFREEGPRRYNDDPDFQRENFSEETVRLHPKVVKWLEVNIENFEGRKGWATGDDEFNSEYLWEIVIVFQRESDAMAFIERWSGFKKPTVHYNYFNDRVGTLDVKTGEYSWSGR